MSKTPQTEEQSDEVTLAWKEPPPITYGSRRQAYPYEQAVEMLTQNPEEWLSLRTGPSNRMDQFKTRFRNFVQPILPDNWEVVCITRSIPGQDVPYDQRNVEVFARVVPLTYEELDEDHIDDQD